MTNPAGTLDRRQAARRIVALAVGAPVLVAVAPDSFAEAERLDPESERARQLGYAHDASQTKRPSAEQSCAQCAHFKPAGDGEWGACAIFSGQHVNAEGWCSAFYARG